LNGKSKPKKAKAKKPPKSKIIKASNKNGAVEPDPEPEKELSDLLVQFDDDDADNVGVFADSFSTLRSEQSFG